jgi:AcrR family transcriptional regulator
VAIPDARERLFAAAERVLAREGPGALTSRAVTDEANCAKGLLHAHFAGLDEFVAELCLDRFDRTAQQAAQLAQHVGEGSVGGNLTRVALALLDSGGPTIAGLAMARPAATLRIREGTASGAPGFAAMQESITEYLNAERRLDRLPAAADAQSIALAVVGVVHHLLMTGDMPGVPEPRAQVERLVAALVGDAGTPDA